MTDAIIYSRHKMPIDWDALWHRSIPPN
jgi:hypothetical protein